MHLSQKRFVLVGGGGGVNQIATHLRNYVPEENITTIVSMMDNGGHSRDLRSSRGILPPGDVCRSLQALMSPDAHWALASLLNYRFPSKGHSSLNGTTPRNIILTAITEICGGDIAKAICVFGEILGVDAKVLPVTVGPGQPHLCVRLSDGTIIKGEGEIDTRDINDDRTIASVFLEPVPLLYAGAYKALVEAYVIVLCPGDLVTSLIPNLLVRGFGEALVESNAQIAYVVNLMTKKAETHGYKVSDFVRTVAEYIPRNGPKIDHLIVNSEPIRPDLLKKYASDKSEPVIIDESQYIECVKRWHVSHYAEQTDVVRHNDQVAATIATL